MKDNIETEGIFRVSPHTILIGVLQEAYDRGQKYILWKENGVTIPCPDYADAKDAQSIIDEVDCRDAYGVTLAASLIKFWYRDLKQPIFRASSYAQLREEFGNLQEPPSMEKIVDLLSDHSQMDLITPTSQDILVRHLLPLLSRVAQRSDKNRMTVQNLAVCFAPTLLLGPDQLEDVKMSSIIRHILEAAIAMWDNSLRDRLNIQSSNFLRDLQPPELSDDYEDPLEERCALIHEADEHGDDDMSKNNGDRNTQITGITIAEVDNIPSSSSATAPCFLNTIQRKPAPPPRPLSSASASSSHGEDSHIKPSINGEGEKVRRKPAPAVAGLPRYSAVISRESLDFDPDLTGTSGMTADGFAPTDAVAAAAAANAANPWDDKKGL